MGRSIQKATTIALAAGLVGLGSIRTEAAPPRSYNGQVATHNVTVAPAPAQTRTYSQPPVQHNIVINQPHGGQNNWPQYHPDQRNWPNPQNFNHNEGAGRVNNFNNFNHGTWNGPTQIFRQGGGGGVFRGHFDDSGHFHSNAGVEIVGGGNNVSYQHFNSSGFAIGVSGVVGGVGLQAGYNNFSGNGYIGLNVPGDVAVAGEVIIRERRAWNWTTGAFIYVRIGDRLPWGDWVISDGFVYGVNQGTGQALYCQDATASDIVLPAVQVQPVPNQVVGQPVYVQINTQPAPAVASQPTNAPAATNAAPTSVKPAAPSADEIRKVVAAEVAAQIKGIGANAAAQAKTASRFNKYSVGLGWGLSGAIVGGLGVLGVSALLRRKPSAPSAATGP